EAPACALQRLIADAGIRTSIERREIFGGGTRQARAVDAHQPLALMDVCPGGDILDRFDEAFETQRYDRLTALVLLNDARRADHRVQGAPLGDLDLNTRLLQFAGADFD